MPEGENQIDTSSPEFKQAAEAWLKDQGIHKALEDEREARKKLESQMSSLKGVDVEEYRKLKSEAEKAEEERQREAGKFDELRKKDQEKFAVALKERDDENAKLRGSLERTLIESAAKSAIAAHGGDAELLLPHVTAATKLIEAEGQHRAVVIDPKGEPRLAPDAKTASDYMGIDHLVAGWKEGGKYPGAFAGTGASGGGAQPNASRGGSGGAKKTIPASDVAALNANAEAIAKGEVQVTFGA